MTPDYTSVIYVNAALPRIETCDCMMVMSKTCPFVYDGTLVRHGHGFSLLVPSGSGHYMVTGGGQCPFVAVHYPWIREQTVSQGTVSVTVFVALFKLKENLFLTLPDFLKWSLPNFAHDTTIMLSWHLQNLEWFYDGGSNYRNKLPLNLKHFLSWLVHQGGSLHGCYGGSVAHCGCKLSLDGRADRQDWYWWWSGVGVA